MSETISFPPRVGGGEGGAGDPGPAGAQGAKGDKGDTGNAGPQGPTGQAGVKGDQGDQGPQGFAGVKGDKGDKGDTGNTGAQGPAGVKGDIGNTGPQGLQGNVGPQGVAGQVGATGSAGATGAQGAQGAQGPQGEAGNVEIVYVVNETAVVQALAAGYTDVTGLVAVVPPHTRPVWLEWHFMVDITTAPAASNSANVDSFVFDELDNIVGSESITVYGANGTAGNPSLSGKCRIDPNVAQKTYRVRSSKTGNATFAGNIYHGSIASAFRSWLTASLR